MLTWHTHSIVPSQCKHLSMPRTIEDGILRWETHRILLCSTCTLAPTAQSALCATMWPPAGVYRLLCRALLYQRPELRVVLMSATINFEAYSQYFGGCPVIQVALITAAAAGVKCCVQCGYYRCHVSVYVDTEVLRRSRYAVQLRPDCCTACTAQVPGRLYPIQLEYCPPPKPQQDAQGKGGRGREDGPTVVGSTAAGGTR
jgi:hypothetical protein